jgi:hypothetical protein
MSVASRNAQSVPLLQQLTRGHPPHGDDVRPLSTVAAAGRGCAVRSGSTYILYNYSGGFSWYLHGPDNRLQYDIAGTLGNGAWGYIVGTYDKDAGADNQRLYLTGARVAQMSDTLPLDLHSNPLRIGRHVSGIADSFNGHNDAFRTAHVQAPTAGSRPPGTR